MNDALRNLNSEAQEALDGSPATSRDAAGFVNIKWQLGPIQERGVNGTSIENVLALVIQRLEGFQHGPVACAENVIALEHLKSAVAALELRTLKRTSRGVEGTLKPH